VRSGGNLGVLAAGVATATLFASPAGAVEREHHVGLDLGGSMLWVNDKNSADVGPMAGAHWTYGLSDAFNLMVEGSWTLLSTNEPSGKTIPHTRPTWGANTSAGVAYVFDVLTWVPYAGVLAGGYALGGGTMDGTQLFFGWSIAAGCDYRVSRNLSAGISARQHMLITALDKYPFFTQVFAELEYTWGW
jgi:hypothetical protein